GQREGDLCRGPSGEETLYRTGQPNRGGVVQGGGSQRPLAGSGDGLQLRLGVDDAPQNRVRAVDQGAAGGGQPQRTAATVEQLGADLTLELRDLLGDRRLGVTQMAGGLGEGLA